MSNVLIFSTALASVLQLGLWMHAVKTRNAGWVDFGWSFSMSMAGLVLIGFHWGEPRGMVVGALVLVWGGRLASHILLDRLLKGNPEDARYQALRAHWGPNADRNFFFFFLGQAFLVPLFLVPACTVASRLDAFPDRWDVLGLLTAVVAVLGESLADRQLATFRGNPDNRGKVCQNGLWRYSRHPNYFFEWVHWLSYVWMAFGTSGWIYTWIGPAFMYLFLRYLTGIPHTERQSLRSRGDAYRRYQQTTSAFFPWIPRKP